ncbi:hypothetical protein GCM10009817_18190 [Terrabacter lapilli]|uniref:Immunity protein 35 of polymorphic toxin system n=1 Tax=Terrabacter lapilli TaxID=436231 RepID=A0ABN2S093_9MICO
MLDEATARREVESVMPGWPKPASPDPEFVVWKVQEHSRAWIAHFATRRWVASRSISDLSVGSSAFVVDKATGAVHLYGSAPSEYDKFRLWLDENGDPNSI